MRLINLFLKFLRKNFLYIFLLFGVVLVYFPSFKLNFSLVDDGLTIKTARILGNSLQKFDSNAIAGVIFEPQHGRVRPAYWIIQSISSWLSFYNSTIFHVLRVTILLVTAYCLEKVLGKLGIGKLWRFMGLFIFLFNFQNLENYYRLGPTEPFLALYYVLTILTIFFFNNLKTKYSSFLLLFLFTLLGVFTKEGYFLIGVSLIPMLVFLSIRRKSKSKIYPRVIFTIGASFLSAIVVFWIKSKYPPIEAYASQYKLSLNQILSSLLVYKDNILFHQPLLLYVAFAYLGLFLYELYKNKFRTIRFGDVLLITFWFHAFLNFIVLLPWPYALNRYLILVNIDLVIIYAMTFAALVERIYKLLPERISRLGISRRVFKSMVVFGFLIPFFIRSIFPIADFQLWQKVDSYISFTSVAALSKTIPSGETAYVNYKKGDSNLEIYLETGWHLEELFNRNDIKFAYLTSTILCSEIDRYIFDRTSDRFLDAKEFSDKFKYELINRDMIYYQPLNYEAVKKSFLFRQKRNDWNQNYLFEWAIYKQKHGTCIDEENIL